MTLKKNPKHYPLDILKKCFGVNNYTKKELRFKIANKGYGYPAKYEIPDDDVFINDVVFNKRGLEIIENHTDQIIINNIEETYIDKKKALFYFSCCIFMYDRNITLSEFSKIINIYMNNLSIDSIENLTKNINNISELYLYVKNQV